ncbi:hypothetical protein Acsp06_36460 [Actinomycetospora sp. NBRC 106375]|uniref:DUF6918 family protein n=1 Tax=Actinomycetospora sp. NBRC 106375 TaxID=3032207 RepID=UPI0024A12925|nr:hypothetical protein [Actinomycetospora sp. NBRC 106375]GLZ47461.1 hypothetical protein Acsp06_36460 [Actinomycetospora sp. NBRC 106375]
MAETLKARLLDTDRRGAVVDDLNALVDSEVANKSGLSGGVVKTGYAGVKKVKPGFVREAIDKMLDDFVEQLEPFWATFTTEATGDFGTFLATRPHEASEALLTVTDRRAERSNRAAVTSIYSKLRPKAQENVIEALPGLGAVIEKHGR